MLWLTLRRRGVGCGVVGLRQGQRNPSQHRSAAETEHQNLITPPRPPPRPPSPTTTITTASCPQHPNPPSQASLLPHATRTSHPRPPDPLHPPAHPPADPSRSTLSRGERPGRPPPAANRRTFPVFFSIGPRPSPVDVTSSPSGRTFSVRSRRRRGSDRSCDRVRRAPCPGCSQECRAHFVMCESACQACVPRVHRKGYGVPARTRWRPPAARRGGGDAVLTQCRRRSHASRKAPLGGGGQGQVCSLAGA